ncbi:MAG: hypothetical protein AAF727_06745 [Pseudomonadota bacterium]
MKFFYAIVIACVALGHVAVAAPDASSGWIKANAVYHGGGCRKSSPPGQCCHAGSKPLHCH